MRAFISIDIPDEAARGITEFQSGMQKQLGVSFAAADKLHITMMFFPDLDSNGLASLASNFSMLKFNRFKVSLNGVGLFTPRIPRVLYIGASSEHGEMQQLYKMMHSLALDKGINFDEKRFVPHLTIGRIKGHVNRIKLLNAIKQFEGYDFGSFICSGFSIKESTFVDRSTEYKDLFTKKLD